MPGVTPLGLRYPYMGETVDATSWQNLANDIDGLMTTIKGLRDKAFRTQTASIGCSTTGPGLVTATGVIANMHFDTVNWDTNGLVNLVANNDRITIGPGIWWARYSVGGLVGVTTITKALIGVTDTGGVNYAQTQMDNYGFSLGSGLTANGVIYNNAAALGIQGVNWWTGTGGPGTWAANGFQLTATLQVTRIRELTDV